MTSVEKGQTYEVFRDIHITCTQRVFEAILKKKIKDKEERNRSDIFIVYRLQCKKGNEKSNARSQ